MKKKRLSKSMDIKFEKIEIQNFKSVGNLVVFDFKEFNGLNFVYGKNLDVPNAKNGSGKCVHPSTRIAVMTEDSWTAKILGMLPFAGEMSASAEVIEVVKLYEKHPECIGKLSVWTPFGWRRILAAEKTFFGKALEVKTHNGLSLVCSEHHKIKTSASLCSEETFIEAKELIEDYHVILTADGPARIKSIKPWKNGKKIDMYDIQVEEVQQYYSNGIVSHNSTIFVDAMMFALFGKTLKNTNNKYIPNRNVSPKLEPYVKLYLSSNGQRYSIKTYGKITSSGMSSGVELLRLDTDGTILEDVTQSSVAKSKEFIEKNILGCSFDIFKSSVVISYADFMNFYEGMKKDQKRKYVENLFKLSCFGEMFSNVKEDSNSLKKEISGAKLGIISENERLEEYEKKEADFENDLEEKRKAAKKKMLDKAEEVKKLIASAKELVFESTEDTAREKKKKISEAIDKLNEAKSKLETDRSSASVSAAHTKKTVSELKSLYAGLCDKCSKMVAEKYDFAAKEKLVEESEELVKKTDEKIAAVTSLLAEKKKQLAAVDAEIEAEYAKRRSKERLDDSVKFAKRELVSLKTAYDAVSEKTENPFTQLSQKSREALTSAKERLSSMAKDYKHLEVLKEVCSETGVKRCIIKDIVKLLNSLIQKYLNEIGCEFIVFFDESFDFKFLTATGECEFSSFSAGERQRIQIATILAFRDLILNNNVSSDLLIIDELLDANVDTVCIKNVMNILKKKTAELGQKIFIISHRSELADDESLWDSIIKIEKQNGCSTYSVR